MNATIRDALLGLVYIGLALLLVGVTVLSYQRAFSNDLQVVLHAQQVGNALRPGSEVKFHGVPVGAVTRIVPHRNGATMELRLNRDRAALIPQDSHVRMLPQTLFGERYVAIIHRSTDGPSLQDGDILTQDTSDEALQIEHLFDSLMPVLTAVQPEKLNASLSELATALRGQGEEIGEAMLTWAAYMRELNPHIPTLARDLELFGEVAESYAEAMPDMLAAFGDMAITGATLADHDAQLRELFATVSGASDVTNEWLKPNSGTIIRLAEDSRRVLGVMARYSPQFPCLATSLRDLIPEVDRHLLGKGTAKPGVRVKVTVVDRKARHGGRPGLTTGGAPSCPDKGGRVVPASHANSAEENRVLTEVLALRAGVSPADYPDWSSLVVGPALQVLG
jgi:phospholipid/cholesterol/gamma-HCH transport system substrate-binding protein